MPIDDKLESAFTALGNVQSDGNIETVVQIITENYERDVDAAVRLARILAEESDTLSFNDAVVADISSSGGPTSLSTLLPQLYLRAAGAKVPKLGVTGSPVGGLDCLAQIPGYRTKLSADEVKQIVGGPAGHAHFLEQGVMAPLDRRMFDIRMSMGQEQFALPTLVAASLLSNKLVAGVKYTGLDIRVYPKGGFGKDEREARMNKAFYSAVARKLKILARPVLTFLEQPYQPYFGRREALLALDCVFRKACPPWLSDHVDTCRYLAMKCLPDHLQTKVAKVTPDELRWYFNQNLVAQNADPADFDTLMNDTKKGHGENAPILANRDGYCFYRIGALSDQLKAWQKTAMEMGEYPDPVGLILLAEPGTKVERGTPIATFRATEALKDQARAQLEAILNDFDGPAW